MNDPRNIPERLPGESKASYVKRLNQIGIACLCGCGRSVKVTVRFLDHIPRYTRHCRPIDKTKHLHDRITFDDDPRRPPYWESWESKREYAKKLNSLPLRCLCGCGILLKVTHGSCVPPPRYRHGCFLKLPVQRKNSSNRLKKQWEDPQYRRNQQTKRFKITVSGELIKRHPDQAEWIKDHAQELDEVLDFYPEHYMNGDNHRECLEGSFEDFSIWERTQIGFYNVLGEKVESLAECRI